MRNNLSKFAISFWKKFFYEVIPKIGLYNYKKIMIRIGPCQMKLINCLQEIHHNCFGILDVLQILKMGRVYLRFWFFCLKILSRFGNILLEKKGSLMQKLSLLICKERGKRKQKTELQPLSRHYTGILAKSHHYSGSLAPQATNIATSFGCWSLRFLMITWVQFFMF